MKIKEILNNNFVIVGDGQEIVITNFLDTLILRRLYNEVGIGMETIETVPSPLAIAYLASGDAGTIGAISAALCGAMNPWGISGDIIEMIEYI